MADSTVVYDIIANDKATAKMNRIGSAAQSSGSHIGSLSDKMKRFAKAGALAAAAAVALAAKLGWDSVNAASDLNEVLSKSEVLFGKASKGMSKWANTAATSIGQSKRAALDAATTFATFGKSAGLTGEKLGGFSREMVELSSDLASFSNSSPEEAVLAIGAALRGESEPIRRFGVLLDDATLRAQALKMGLIETTKDALTPQQKVLAAHAQILKQTSDAQGDFARTSDGMANQQRILRAQFEDLQASIGRKLLPVATDVLSWANDMIPALQGGWRELSKKFGPAVETTGDAFKKLLPKAEDFGEWLDEKGTPALKGFYEFLDEDLNPALRETAGAFSDANRDAKPFFDLLDTFTPEKQSSWKNWVDILVPADETLRALGLAAKYAGKQLGLVGAAATFAWNEGLQPMFKLAAEGVSVFLGGLSDIFGALASIPGAPKWIGKTARALELAAFQAKQVAANIDDIPTRKDITIAYHYQGSAQGGMGNGDVPLGSGGGRPGGGGGGGGGGFGPRRSSRGMSAGGTDAMSIAQALRTVLDGARLQIVPGTSDQFYLLTGTGL